VQAPNNLRVKLVLLYVERVKHAAEIREAYDISERTLRRWARAYRKGGLKALEPKRRGPRRRPRNSTKKRMEERILALKQKHPSWGARRIKHQYGPPCHWATVHRVIKRHVMLIRIKAKPQPSKRFQRYHVDSMWQGDSFEFRIADVGRVYVTGFTDDRSRYRVRSGAYLDKSAKESVDALRRALLEGRITREMYLDNGKQFIAKEFKAELAKYHIRPIFGKPYHPRGRGKKIEGYHKALWNELISQVRFSSLSHFKRELQVRQAIQLLEEEPIPRMEDTASIYNDERYFNKGGAARNPANKSGHKS
jgi:putative transposase